MAKKSFRLAGRLVKGRARGQLQGLRVEAWDSHLQPDSPLGSALVDSSGSFSVDLEEPQYKKLFASREPHISFRVFRGKKLLADTARSQVFHSLSVKKPIVIKLGRLLGKQSSLQGLSESEAASLSQAIAQRFPLPVQPRRLEGRLLTAEGHQPLVGYSVQLRGKTPDGSELWGGYDVTDSEGHFALGLQDPALQSQVPGPGTRLLVRDPSAELVETLELAAVGDRSLELSVRVPQGSPTAAQVLSDEPPAPGDGSDSYGETGPAEPQIELGELKEVVPTDPEAWRQWRGSKLLWQYPENALIPSLLVQPSPAFPELLGELRACRELGGQKANQFYEQYHQYLRDIASLSLQASCVTEARDNSSEGESSYQGRIFFFAQAESSGKAYWSSASLDGTEQSHWQQVPGLPELARVLGAVPFGPAREGRHILVFAQLSEAKGDSLLLTRYDLDHNRWDDSPVYLSPPESAEQFEAVIEQRQELWRHPQKPDWVQREKDPPWVAFYIRGKGIFLRKLAANALGWDLSEGVKHLALDSLRLISLCALIRIPFGQGLYQLFASAYAPMGSGPVATVQVMTFSGPVPPTPLDPHWEYLRTQGASWVGVYLHPFTWDVYAFVRQGKQVYYGVTAGTHATGKAETPGPEGWLRLAVHCGQADGAQTAHIAFETDCGTPSGLYRALLRQSLPSYQLLEAARLRLSPQITYAPLLQAPYSEGQKAQWTQSVQKLSALHRQASPHLSVYLQEAYWAVPTQLALELELRGHYSEALGWLELALSLSESLSETKGQIPEPGLIEPENANWTEDPLQPHLIAALRPQSQKRYLRLRLAQCLMLQADGYGTWGYSIEGQIQLYYRAKELLEDGLFTAIQDNPWLGALRLQVELGLKALEAEERRQRAGEGGPSKLSAEQVARGKELLGRCLLLEKSLGKLFEKRAKGGLDEQEALASLCLLELCGRLPLGLGLGEGPGVSEQGATERLVEYYHLVGELLLRQGHLAVLGDWLCLALAPQLRRTLGQAARELVGQSVGEAVRTGLFLQEPMPAQGELALAERLIRTLTELEP